VRSRSSSGRSFEGDAEHTATRSPPQNSRGSSNDTVRGPESPDEAVGYVRNTKSNDLLIARFELSEITESDVLTFDSKPWSACMSLRQVKAFFRHACGEDLEQDWTKDDTTIETLRSVQERYVGLLTRKFRCALAQLFNPDGLLVDIFVSHAGSHQYRNLVMGMETFANRFADEASDSRSVDGRSTRKKTEAEDVAFWMCPLSLNQYRIKELVRDSVPLSESPFAKALERSTCCLLALDSDAKALTRLWVVFELLHAERIGKLVEGSAEDLREASKSLLRIRSKNAEAEDESDVSKILQEVDQFEDPIYGRGFNAADTLVKDAVRGMLLRCFAREGHCGDVPHALLAGMGSEQTRVRSCRKAAELASYYHNVDLYRLCAKTLPHSALITNMDAAGVGQLESGVQQAAADHRVDVDIGKENLRDFPAPVPVARLEFVNIAVDFSQRLSVLWAASVEWPPILDSVARVPLVLSFDLGIVCPMLRPSVGAVCAWLLPLMLLYAVFILDQLHTGKGVFWDRVFAQNWLRTLSGWLGLFFLGTAVLALTALTTTAVALQQGVFVLLVFWLLAHVVVFVLVLIARAQAQRVHQVSRDCGLDDGHMMTGFHCFVRNSVCIGLWFLFGASWVAPIRACLDMAMDAEKEDFATMQRGCAMIVAAFGAFLVLPSFCGIAAYGVSLQNDVGLLSYKGVPLACLVPAPFSMVLLALVIVLFATKIFRTFDFYAVAGIMLPWSVCMPLVCILLSIGVFRAHPFCALIMGNFRFQYHRVVSFLQRVVFAFVVFASAMDYVGREARALDILPGLGVLATCIVYTAVVRPHTLPIGNAMEIASSVVLATIALIPIYPSSTVLAIFLAVLPIVFVAACIYNLSPKSLILAMRSEPGQMVARIQATIHSPEWMYSRPLFELERISSQDVVFWSIKNVNALAYRACSCDDKSVSARFHRLLELCASHAQDRDARSAARDVVEALSAGDLGALRAHLKPFAEAGGGTAAMAPLPDDEAAMAIVPPLHVSPRSRENDPQPGGLWSYGVEDVRKSKRPAGPSEDVTQPVLPSEEPMPPTSRFPSARPPGKRSLQARSGSDVGQNRAGSVPNGSVAVPAGYPDVATTNSGSSDVAQEFSSVGHAEPPAVAVAVEVAHRTPMPKRRSVPSDGSLSNAASTPRSPTPKKRSAARSAMMSCTLTPDEVEQPLESHKAPICFPTGEQHFAVSASRRSSPPIAPRPPDGSPVLRLPSGDGTGQQLSSSDGSRERSSSDASPFKSTLRLPSRSSDVRLKNRMSTPLPSSPSGAAHA